MVLTNLLGGQHAGIDRHFSQPTVEKCFQLSRSQSHRSVTRLRNDIVSPVKRTFGRRTLLQLSVDVNGDSLLGILARAGIVTGDHVYPRLALLRATPEARVLEIGAGPFAPRRVEYVRRQAIGTVGAGLTVEAECPLFPL